LRKTRKSTLRSRKDLLDAGLENLRDRQVKRVEVRSAAEAAERLASFGKRHRLSLGGLKIKDLINEGRR
jgi:hypothetical protein